MSPAWYPDEFKMAGVDFEDAGQVKAYDHNQTASTTEKEQALVARLGILPGQTVIDMGGRDRDVCRSGSDRRSLRSRGRHLKDDANLRQKQSS